MSYWSVGASGPWGLLPVIRRVFVGFVAAIFMFAFVLAVAAPKTGGSPWLWAAAALLAGGAAEGVRNLAERPLDCSSESLLVDSWRTRFFVRMACAEVSALVGFVGVFVTGHWWVYLFGALPTLLAFRRVAPTTSNLQREAAELASSGCGLDLFAVLSNAPGPAR